MKSTTCSVVTRLLAITEPQNWTQTSAFYTSIESSGHEEASYAIKRKLYREMLCAIEWITFNPGTIDPPGPGKG